MSIETPFTPPMIDGVSASQIYLPNLASIPCSIFAYFCEIFPHISPQEWQQRFDHGLIYLDDGKKLTISSCYCAHRTVFYYRFLTHEVPVPFTHEILFENEHFLVVDKPHFLTISPTGKYVKETLLVRLKQQSQNEFLTPIHRLDRETAGLVLFSKQAKTRGLYQNLFAQRQVTKIYHAIAAFQTNLNFPQTVRLRMEKGNPFYTMQQVEGVANSETQIALIEHNHTWAKYLLQPVTGKQHQLRLHLSTLGIAIRNDPFYPKVQHKADDDFSQPLQLLAKKISFIDPITQQHFEFESKQNLQL